MVLVQGSQVFLYPLVREHKLYVHAYILCNYGEMRFVSIMIAFDFGI